jgi:hypothetical protein
MEQEKKTGFETARENYYALGFACFLDIFFIS